ncbi:hypothetical protein [Yersinia enterocolitica]|uniref:hypothetical protein n=1 Tax=Yersinia enterocolitica TaxID=630 RepID=UPI003F433726
MNEKPILFNAEMVQAILSGRKTMTRRIMRDQPEVIPPEDECGVPGYWIPYNAGKTMVRNEMMTISCPLGNPGDQLWVRETWARYNIDQASHDMAYRATTPADWPKDGLWRPSIHMPRWASRINLLITGVRVERLQAITLGDICKEIGCGLYDFRPATYGFQVWEKLWKSIYGEESWQANPWVWVINFERMEAK